MLSDISWDALYQRPQHIAVRMSDRVTVLWVEPATLGRKMYLVPHQISKGLYRITVPMIPLNARNKRIRILASLVARLRVVRSIVGWSRRILVHRAVAHLGGGEVRFLVENFQIFDIADRYPQNHVVFDYIDDAFGFTKYPSFVKDLWKKTLSRADCIIATSQTLVSRIQRAISRDVMLIPNGVESERFMKKGTGAAPGDLPADGRPMIGYVGSVYPWIDFELVEAAVQRFPGFHFVFLGQIHGEVRDALTRLGTYENFRYLGAKRYDEVPGYLSAFHVGLIPFRRNTLTEGVNPVKLYEYAAAGLPIVATDFSDDTRNFGDLVFVARSREEFQNCLLSAVAARNNEAYVASLRAFAMKNDWNNRCDEIARCLGL